MAHETATLAAYVFNLKYQDIPAEVLDRATVLTLDFLGSAIRARREAERVGRLIRRALEEQGDPTDLIGPAPCFYERLRGDYRWQVVLRAPDPRPLIPEALPQGWVVDVDPVTLL